MDADLCPINRDISGHTIFVVDRSDAFSANLKSILVDKMYVEASRRVSLPFNQSGPNSGSAQSSMADMRIATGPWD